MIRVRGWSTAKPVGRAQGQPASELVGAVLEVSRYSGEVRYVTAIAKPWDRKIARIGLSLTTKRKLLAAAFVVSCDKQR